MSTEPAETCPLPTPELVAALANAFIEEQQRDCGSTASMDRAFLAIVGQPSDPWTLRVATLRTAAQQLAHALGYPMPYQTQVHMLDGSLTALERHTITHFVDGEGYSEADWAAISALEVGEAYAIKGDQAVMVVTRME